jgi:hypothetical protein
MATKEDILEQIVEEYLIHEGYFVQHNIKYRPSKDHSDFLSTTDRVHSDIDVIGYHPRREDQLKVVVVSCKSWQSGFHVRNELRDIVEDKRYGDSARPARLQYRELAIPKWSEGFIKAIRDATGTNRFTYYLAVAKLVGDKSVWENHQPFRDAIGGNPVKILTFREMVTEILAKLTTTPAATEVGRMLQIFKAAGIRVE